MKPDFLVGKKRGVTARVTKADLSAQVDKPNQDWDAKDIRVMKPDFLVGKRRGVTARVRYPTQTRSVPKEAKIGMLD